MSQKPRAAQVPGLENVANAIAQARKSRTDGPDFKIGICDDDHHVIAVEVMDSVQQVTRLTALLEPLGYSMWALGLAAEMHGCDVVYRKTGMAPGAPREPAERAGHEQGTSDFRDTAWQEPPQRTNPDPERDCRYGKSAANKEIRIGDLVIAAVDDGSPLMTVDALSCQTELATCYWFEAGRRRYRTLPVSQLRKVQDGPSLEADDDT